MSEAAIHSCSLPPHKPNSSHAWANLGGLATPHCTYGSSWAPCTAPCLSPFLGLLMLEPQPVPKPPNSPRPRPIQKFSALCMQQPPVNLIAPLAKDASPHLHCTCSRGSITQLLKNKHSCTILTSFPTLLII